MKKLAITNYLSLKKKLDKIPVDIEQDIFLLDEAEFGNLLLDFEEGRLNEVELEKIADLLESKDGIRFKQEYIKESFHKIANIDIQGINMAELVSEIVRGFKIQKTMK